MPDYKINPDDYPDWLCAFCGETNDLVAMHLRAKRRGGVATVTGCRGCNSSMSDDTLKKWLRRLCDQQHWKWIHIIVHHKGRRSGLSYLIRAIRDEGKG